MVKAKLWEVSFGYTEKPVINAQSILEAIKIALRNHKDYKETDIDGVRLIATED